MNAALTALALLAPALAGAAEPLPSWNPGPARQAVLDFVAAAVDPAAPGFVPEPERIAVFDNDGTLWAEQPVYFQFLFALDRAAGLAAGDPAWAATPALKAAAAGDTAALLAGGKEALVEVVLATHSGATVEGFTEAARLWFDRARHPLTGRSYAGMTYRPMRELMDHLRASGFKVYIVSGGGVDFMRAFAEAAYGVPPENVIGSLGAARVAVVDGRTEVMKDPAAAFVDDGEGKPVGIARHIGRRPVFVAGNSDGDLAMAQWAASGAGPRFVLFVHHTDAAREWDYDRESPIGRLDAALDEAQAKGWTVVDMARDWSAIWSGD